MKIQGYSNAHDLKAILQSAYDAGQRVKLAKNNTIAVYDKPTSIFGRLVNWLREVTGRNRREHAQVVRTFQRLVDLEPSVERVKSRQTLGNVSTPRLSERTATVPDAIDSKNLTDSIEKSGAAETRLNGEAGVIASPTVKTRFVESHRELKDYFQQQKLPIINEESDVDVITERDETVMKKQTVESKDAEASKPIGEAPELVEDAKVPFVALRPKSPLAERQKEVAAARKFIANLHNLKAKDWEGEVQEYLNELARIAEQTVEPELTQEIAEAEALCELKLELSTAHRQTNQFVNRYKVASPKLLIRSEELSGENLQDVLTTLAPQKSIDEVHRQLKEYKALWEQKLNAAVKAAATRAASQFIKGASELIYIARDPHVLVAKEELQLSSTVLASLEGFRSQQLTELGYLHREEALQQAEEIYTNHKEGRVVLNEVEIEQVLKSLAAIGSDGERVAALAVATDELKKLESDLLLQDKELIRKFQALVND